MPEEKVSLPFPTQEQLKSAALDADHDLWPRVKDADEDMVRSPPERGFRRLGVVYSRTP